MRCDINVQFVANVLLRDVLLNDTEVLNMVREPKYARYVIKTESINHFLQTNAWENPI